MAPVDILVTLRLPNKSNKVTPEWFFFVIPHCVVTFNFLGAKTTIGLLQMQNPEWSKSIALKKQWLTCNFSSPIKPGQELRPGKAPVCTRTAGWLVHVNYLRNSEFHHEMGHLREMLNTPIDFRRAEKVVFSIFLVKT